MMILGVALLVAIVLTVVYVARGDDKDE